MPGYKHPCRYCSKLVDADDNVCPFCGKVNPVGPLRCPKCKNPIQEGQMRCSSCGQSLDVKCPYCKKDTFLGDYCMNCGERLTVICPNKKCRTEQPPISEKCIKCGTPLNTAR
jgi:RNA polymerase subunit RPABC4/transcription elongation factor Spt4